MKLFKVLSLFIVLRMLVPANGYCTTMPTSKIELTSEQKRTEVTGLPNEWMLFIFGCILLPLGAYPLIKGLKILAAVAPDAIFTPFIGSFLAGFGSVILLLSLILFIVFAVQRVRRKRYERY